MELLPEFGERRFKSLDDAGITIQVLSNSGSGPRSGARCGRRRDGAQDQRPSGRCRHEACETIRGLRGAADGRSRRLPRRDHEHLCLRERLQVGGDVRRRRPAAMHATESAGGHQPDPSRLAHRQRSPDRRRAGGVLHDRRGEVARPELAGCRVEAHELRLGQADDDLAVEHTDRRRTARPRARLARMRVRPRRLRRPETRARPGSSRARRCRARLAASAALPHRS